MAPRDDASTITRSCRLLATGEASPSTATRSEDQAERLFAFAAAVARRGSDSIRLAISNLRNDESASNAL